MLPLGGKRGVENAQVMRDFAKVENGKKKKSYSLDELCQ